MNANDDNGKSKKKLVEEYVQAQLEIMKKHGTPVKLSNSKYKSLVQKVERAIAT